MNLQYYQQLITEALQDFSLNLPQHPYHLYEPINYTLRLGGKRMRPVLALAGAGLFIDNVSPALPAAVAIELFHNFTLLHDDIMDNAPLRRGKATVHEKWNPNIAILSGDALFAEAFRMISKSPVQVLPQVLDLFTQTAIEVCEGQQLDMDFEEQSSTTITDYLRMIELKTAILLAASLSIGASCAGATAIEAKKLYEFGRQVGIAFQLQDDILDVYGNPETFGKQPGGDIIANKKTFLLLSAIERANSYQREELLQWMQVDSTKATEKVTGITALYNSLNIRELAQNKMQEYYAAGIAALESVDADPIKKKTLKAFTDSLMVREA